jgi:tetratricopeptide (TPR) repeat protein
MLNRLQREPMMPDLSSAPDTTSETPRDSDSVSCATLLTSPQTPSGETTTPPLPAIVEPASETAPDTAGLIGRYPVFGEIGRGGMGAVLRGRDPLLGRELAIKVLRDEHAGRPDLVRRFVEEARVGGRLQHPGVVPVYELGQADIPSGEIARPYFTMKLIEGRTLALLLAERRDPTRDLPLLLKIFEQVCQTLAYAHARGILHRDLKPANIMVGAFGEVQVMDWGLAKTLDGATDAARNAGEATPETTDHALTGAGAIMGTPAYMSPEQARGELLDERADVFGLGAILCEILTGRPPHTNGRGGAILEQAQRGDLRPAIDRLDKCAADADLVQLAKDCLAPQAADRPRHAGVVAERMTIYLGAVQDRLRAAELERAAAQARAKEARAKAAAERRARRLTVTLATSLLLTMLGGTAVAVWVQSDRATRAAQEKAREVEQARKESDTVQAISLNLEQAREELDRDQHAAALAAARRAEGLLAGGGESLRPRVEEMLADLEMLQRLEEVRLETVELLPDQSGFDPLALLPRYQQAFDQYGIPLRTLEVGEAADRLRARAIRAQLLAALDHWAAFVPDAATRRRLLSVAQMADPDPDGVMATLRRARIDENSKAFKQVVFSDGRVKSLPPLTLFVLGSSLLAGGDASGAVRLLEKALGRNPRDFWLSYQLGVALTQLKPPRNAEAVRFYTAAVALRPDVPSLWVNLGGALALQGRLAEAIAAFNKALEYKPDFALAHYSLGIARLRADEMAAGRKSLEEAMRLRPDFAPAHYALGNLLARQRSFDEAEKHLREAIRLKPNYADAHNDLANILALRGQPDEAIRSYQTALKHAPEDAKIWENLGEMQGRRGLLRESEQALEKALNLKPDYVEVLNDLGYVRLQQGRLEEAASLLRKAVALQPNDLRAYGNLVEVLRRGGEQEDLLAVYRKLVALHPSGETWNALGSALLDHGDIDESVAACRKAIELKADFADPHVNLGLSLLRRGDFAQAKKQLEQGLQLLDRRDPRRGAVQGWVNDCGKMSRLADKLPSILKGDARPADNAERLLLAGYCQQSKHLYGAAARFYDEAFAADGKLADDLHAGNRYQAACAAVLAAAGRGDDVALDDKERERWRKLALSWLRADLALWSKLHQGAAAERARASGALRHWQRDADLSAVREEAGRTWLPRDEREAWRKLWADVDELCKKTGS